MRDDTMVFVTEDNKAVITCPECEKLKQVSVGRFKGSKHSIKVQCSCGNGFLLNLNFRKGTRKQVNLEGTYRKVSQHPSLSEKCTVVDLSFRGIRIKILDIQDLKVNVDDELMVQFVLDDKRKTEVKRKIKICSLIQEDLIGAKFIDYELDNYDKSIGFYLMH